MTKKRSGRKPETPAFAQTPLTGYGPPISLDEALRLVQRGVKQSAKKGLRLAFAVVEPAGELVAFARMDDVPYGSIGFAQQKARTSARLRIASTLLEERVQDGRLAFLSFDGVIAIGGGVPIIVDGRVIGALGVSGASAAEDSAIAAATVATL